MEAPTIADVIVELKRELAMRERVFPNWVARGTIKLDTAEYRIACMREAIRLLEPTLL